MAHKPVGDIIDGLGVKADIDDTDLIGGAIVLLKVIGEDGHTRVQAGWSDGTFFERIGMLRVVERLLVDALGEQYGEDDDL